MVVAAHAHAYKAIITIVIVEFDKKIDIPDYNCSNSFSV